MYCANLLLEEKIVARNWAWCDAVDQKRVVRRVSGWYAGI